MVVSNNISVTKKGATYVVEVNGNTTYVPTSDVDWTNLYNLIRNSRVNREQIFNDFINNGIVSLTTVVDENNNVVEEKVEITLSAEEKLNRGLTAMLNFFKEFEFEPNFRFVNTVVGKVASSSESAIDYITNYFSLMDNSYKNEVSAKMKSKEFNNILEDIKAIGSPKHTVNNRFKIYYGSAGTGKTTMAMSETAKRCIVCNSSMLPSDLMEDFVFDNGHPSFKPSSLWRCMEEGKSIVLDEINLLPFDSLRFLQGILDGKSEFEYKGMTVHINDGFEIIGTMNLSIGGMTYGLPEPLVDRTSDIKQFRLTADMLAKCITE